MISVFLSTSGNEVASVDAEELAEEPGVSATEILNSMKHGTTWSNMEMYGTTWNNMNFLPIYKQHQTTSMNKFAEIYLGP